MPRKTIAALEERNAGYEETIRSLRGTIEALEERIEEQRAREVEQARHVFLSYTPSGDAELDALQVAGRAIESLQDPGQRDRCARYLAARFIPERAGDAPS